jgi:hypothetical protein
MKEQGHLNEILAIIDEFDSAFFLKENGLRSASKLLPKVGRLIGFSGSDLREFHIRAAVKAIEG